MCVCVCVCVCVSIHAFVWVSAPDIGHLLSALVHGALDLGVLGAQVTESARHSEVRRKLQRVQALPLIIHGGPQFACRRQELGAAVVVLLLDAIQALGHQLFEACVLAPDLAYTCLCVCLCVCVCACV